MSRAEEAEVGGSEKDGDLVLAGLAVDRVVYAKARVSGSRRGRAGGLGRRPFNFRRRPAVLEEGRIEGEGSDGPVFDQVQADRVGVEEPRVEELDLEPRRAAPDRGVGAVGDRPVLVVGERRESGRESGVGRRIRVAGEASCVADELRVEAVGRDAPPESGPGRAVWSGAGEDARPGGALPAGRAELPLRSAPRAAGGGPEEGGKGKGAREAVPHGARGPSVVVERSPPARRGAAGPGMSGGTRCGGGRRWESGP